MPIVARGVSIFWAKGRSNLLGLGPGHPPLLLRSQPRSALPSVDPPHARGTITGAGGDNRLVSRRKCATDHPALVPPQHIHQVASVPGFKV